MLVGDDGIPRIITCYQTGNQSTRHAISKTTASLPNRYSGRAEGLWRMRWHAHSLFSIVQCTDSEVFPKWLQAMDLPSLVYRRYRADMIEVYKFIHIIYKSGQSLLPMASLTALRWHMFKLKKRYCHKQLRSSFFSFRVINLPSNVVSAPSVNAFKERLDKHWKDYRFTLDPEDFSQRHQVTSDQPEGLSGLTSKAEDRGKGK